MSRFTVVVTDHVFEPFDLEAGILAEVDATLRVHQCKSQDEMREAVRDADGILNTYLGTLDADLFEAAPGLKVVSRYGIGLDTVDLAAATAAGVMVTNVPDYCVSEVADHALAHFLGAARKITLADRHVRNGEWSLDYVRPLTRIAETTAGLIGLGKIGRAIADRLRPFGLKVVFFDPAVDEPTQGAEPVSLEALLGESDVIFVQCPADEQTHHLIDADAMAKMAKRPILVNCARGPIVDTDALVHALESGQVAAAGLDVLEDPEAVIGSAHPLRRMDQVTLTPHSAWLSTQSFMELRRRAAEHVAQALAGRRPENLVNPEVWENRRR